MTSPPDEHLVKESTSKEFLLRVQAVHKQLLDDLDYKQLETLQTDQEALEQTSGTPLVRPLRSSPTRSSYLLHEIEKVIKKINFAIDDDAKQKLAAAVLDEVIGFGPVEPLLRDESITDIFINSPNSVFVERHGRVEKIPIHFLDNEHIFRLVQRVAAKSGRHLDLGTPYFDAQLPDGSRIHAIIPPIALDGIKVSLRKYQFQKLRIDSLVEGGSLTADMARFLKIAVKARYNIAICGGTGSGKTTLMNSLLASVGHGERMVTIEDTPELEISHPHTVRLLTRLPNPEGKGGVTQADLMINALRMRPDRVILGELRGAEAFNLLHAMNTGQDGCMVTLHSSGAEEVISRLLNMILMARYALSVESVRQQVASALDLIVYVTRLSDGSRRVMTISQVSGDEAGNIKIEDIFRYDIETITEHELKGKFVSLGTPPTKRALSKLTTSGLTGEYGEIFSTKK